MNDAPPAPRLSYVLVTPARNEEAFIERTLESVVNQTTRPLRWVVVSDGSTDGTDGLVRRYVERHPWIELLRLEERGGRSFASKAHAFHAGWERLRPLPYDLIGNLDADVSFDEDLFAVLVRRFDEMPDLGVAGAVLVENGRRYDYRFTDVNDVSGPCQLFRRACLEEIGGYVPIEGGGIDAIAVTTARMKGWRTRTFVEHTYLHHRQLGSAARSGWEPWFRLGEKDYVMGGHPLWQAARSLYQSAAPPYIIGGLMLLAGYTYRTVLRAERPVPRELVQFRRAEQMARLKRTADRLLPVGPGPDTVPHGNEIAVTESLARLEAWVESRGYMGYEPFDGLSSSLRRLTFGNTLLQRLLQQVGRQSPINLRPLLGVKPVASAIGRAYMTSGYLTSLRRSGRERYRRKAVESLEWLMRNTTGQHPEYTWGHQFDYASRGGQWAKREPTTVWTSLIGQVFLDAYEALGDERYLDVAASVCRWIVALPRQTTDRGCCLSYLACRQISIHNANLLAAAMLARTARHTGAQELVDLASAAVAYSCSRQLPSGAWYYGEEPQYRWIDSFHSGYVLDSLQAYLDSTGDRSVAPHLERGARHFKATFFESDGRPRYYQDRTYPIDIQCAAQGIETLVKCARDDAEALPIAERVARWTIRNMQDPSGYFYYRRYPFAVAKIAMLHWGQGTMYRALALLLLARGRHDDGSPA